MVTSSTKLNLKSVHNSLASQRLIIQSLEEALRSTGENIYSADDDWEAKARWAFERFARQRSFD
jgi:hypothetical protein